MKRINLSILFTLLSFMAFSQSLKVVVKQDGKVIDPVDNVIQLKKHVFQFEIVSTDLEGFLVASTLDKGLFEEAVDYSNTEIEWFQNTGMAEELYNENKELVIMDYAPSYWYYTDKNDHRFDRNPKRNTANKWTATRTFEKLYSVESEVTYDFNELDDDFSVYILMYAPEYNDDYDFIGKKNLFL